jgi:hypothetical protein
VLVESVEQQTTADANQNLDPKAKNIERLSHKLTQRQIILFAHIIRLDNSDPMKKISIEENGDRVKADFKRRGRPRMKWYNTTRARIITKLTEDGLLPPEATRIMTTMEINDIITQCAVERII